MSDRNRPIIDPVTDEQRHKEEALSRQIRDVESATVREMLPQTPTPADLVTVIENASGFAEATTKKYRHPDSPPVACKEGCYWCCYQNVMISAPEAFRIVRFLRNNMEDGIRDDVVGRLRKLDCKTRGSTSSSRAKLRLPCAFLHDGRCMIYPVRPLACAEFTSYNVQDCKRGQRIGFECDSVIHEKARLIAYGAISRGMFDGLREALPTSDNSPLELTAAVVAALDNVDGETEWIHGGDIFSGAHLVAEPTVSPSSR